MAKQFNPKPSALELEADKLLRAAGCEELTTTAFEKQDRVWREHNDQLSMYEVSGSEYYDAEDELDVQDMNASAQELDLLYVRELMQLAEDCGLTERQRQCLIHWEAEFSPRETASVLKCSKLTVIRDLRKSFESMKQRLDLHPYFWLRDVLRETFGKAMVAAVYGK
jgi:DNA-directed RNA polymerase specialized sigma24 family protein